MHFYPFNIGDYASATAHLEPLEDLAYRRLLDLYYSTEKPIPLDLNQVARLIRMRSHSECIAIVLSDFFKEESDGYHCDRIDVELFKYHEKSSKAKESAKARWKKYKDNQQLEAPCERIANAVETQCEGNAKQELELRTKKQETINKLEDAFNYFWLNMSMKKAAKPRSETSFKKLAKKEDDPMAFAQMLIDDTNKRSELNQFGFDKLNPTTYLNQKRWEDDKPVNEAEEFKYVIDAFNEAMNQTNVPLAEIMTGKRINSLKHLFATTPLTPETVVNYFNHVSTSEAFKWERGETGNDPVDLSYFLTEQAYNKAREH